MVVVLDEVPVPWVWMDADPASRVSGDAVELDEADRAVRDTPMTLTRGVDWEPEL